MWGIGGGLSCVTGVRSVGNLLSVLEGFFVIELSVVVVPDPRTVFLTVFECPLYLPRCLSSERNIGELLVVKTVRYHQVIPFDRVPECE